MTYARMALWKRGPGSLIAATGLRELASSQHGGWLAEEDEEQLQAAAPTGAAASAASSKV